MDEDKEREYCRVAVAEASMSGNVTPDWLERQRAAARAEQCKIDMAVEYEVRGQLAALQRKHSALVAAAHTLDKAISGQRKNGGKVSPRVAMAQAALRALVAAESEPSEEDAHG